MNSINGEIATLPFDWKPWHGIKFPVYYQGQKFETYDLLHTYIKSHFPEVERSFK